VPQNPHVPQRAHEAWHTQLPAPSQRELSSGVVHSVPAATFDVMLHTGPPELHEIVPFAQSPPHAEPA
jgi:hypothetical protein